MVRRMLGALYMCVAASVCLLAAPQTAPDVPPDATPQIQQITPAQAIPGSHVTITIQGNNFSGGAYASSASSAVHIDSCKRISATQLEVQLSVSASAAPGTASILVSNPASGTAESAFSIVAANAEPAPAPPAQTPEPPKPSAPPASGEPAAPATPQTPASPPSAPPAPEANPAAPATPPVAEPVPAPATSPAPAVPAELPGPEVTKVTPRNLAQGFDIDLALTGKNFVPGTKVSFANQGIRVLGFSSSSSTEITVHIKVAGDAPTGKTSLFVINPDDNEVEVPLEVALKGTLTPPPVAPAAPGTVATPDPSYTQRFDAFHLGNPTEIFHVHGKVKGSIVLTSDTVKYEEDKKTLVNISLSEIQEVKTAGIGGFNIKLNSGKTIHFAAASLKGSDARIIVDAIRKAMPAAPAPAEN